MIDDLKLRLLANLRALIVQYEADTGHQVHRIEVRRGANGAEIDIGEFVPAKKEDGTR